jgi:hypothetical protein
MATYMSFINNPSGPDDARLYLAVSYGSDPRGLWCLVAHPSISGLYRYDEPWIGVTGDKITISANLFNIDTNAYLGVDTRIYNKQDMLDCVPARWVRTGYNPSVFAVRPAQHMTAGNDQVAATIEGSTVKVIRYAGLPGVSGVTQTVSNVSLIYGHAAPFDASDGTGTIETGDGRLVDAWVDGDRVWVSTSTRCDWAASIKSCAQFIEITLSTMSLRQEIVDGNPLRHVIYPAARTDSSGNLLAVMGAFDQFGILAQVATMAVAPTIP